jgi:hypothetical protein
VAAPVHREHSEVQAVEDELEPMLIVPNPLEQFVIGGMVLKDLYTTSHPTRATEQGGNNLGEAMVVAASVLDLHLNGKRRSPSLYRCMKGALPLTEVIEKDLEALLAEHLFLDEPCQSLDRPIEGSDPPILVYGKDADPQLLQDSAELVVDVVLSRV